MPKEKLLFRYEVTVFGVLQNCLVDLTMRCRSEYIYIFNFLPLIFESICYSYRTSHHRVSCCAVLKAFKTRHSSFLKDMHLYYDQSRVLYSTGDLRLQVVRNTLNVIFKLFVNILIVKFEFYFFIFIFFNYFRTELMRIIRLIKLEYTLLNLILISSIYTN
jgi:hypothetical protein